MLCGQDLKLQLDRLLKATTKKVVNFLRKKVHPRQNTGYAYEIRRMRKMRRRRRRKRRRTGGGRRCGGGGQEEEEKKKRSRRRRKKKRQEARGKM